MIFLQLMKHYSLMNNHYQEVWGDFMKNKKFYSQAEIREMWFKNRELPKTTNPKGKKKSFVVKVRHIFGEKR